MSAKMNAKMNDPHIHIESFTRHSMQLAEQVRGAARDELDSWVHHRSPEVLKALLDNPALTERQLLVLLSRKDLSREILSRIAQNREWMNSYAAKLAVVKHPRTPRHISFSLLKFIYLFDLLGVAMSPGVPAELKRLAEEGILAQKERLALGQRISLARRGSARIAAGLLTDGNRRVIETALSNPSLTEHAVAAALLAENAPPELTEIVSGHTRWIIRRSIKQALVRSQHLSLGQALKILPELGLGELSDLVSDRRVAGNLRIYARRTILARRRGIQEHEQNG